MDKLEKEVGATLFIRKRSGVLLTPAGELLAKRAPGYIRSHKSLMNDIRKAAQMGEMRV